MPINFELLKAAQQANRHRIDEKEARERREQEERERKKTEEVVQYFAELGIEADGSYFCDRAVIIADELEFRIEPQGYEVYVSIKHPDRDATVYIPTFQANPAEWSQEYRDEVMAGIFNRMMELSPSHPESLSAISSIKE